MIIEHPEAMTITAALAAAGFPSPLPNGIEVGIVAFSAEAELANWIRTHELRGPAVSAADRPAATAFARRLLERGHATAVLVAGAGSAQLLETDGAARARGN